MKAWDRRLTTKYSVLKVLLYEFLLNRAKSCIIIEVAAMNNEQKKWDIMLRSFTRKITGDIQKVLIINNRHVNILITFCRVQMALLVKFGVEALNKIDTTTA